MHADVVLNDLMMEEPDDGPCRASTCCFVQEGQAAFAAYDAMPAAAAPSPFPPGAFRPRQVVWAKVCSLQASHLDVFSQTKVDIACS